MVKTHLRDTLIKIQEEEVLKEYLGDAYDNATPQEKEKFLSYVKDSIEDDVDKMLNEHVQQHIKKSPEKKSHNKLMMFYTTFSVLLTGLSGYGINEKDWYIVIIAYTLLIATQSLPYIINKK